MTEILSLIVWDWGWGFRMIFNRNFNVKYKHLKCTMKHDTFILNGLKQSTCGSFNSQKCSAEWKNHLSAHLSATAEFFSSLCFLFLLHVNCLPSKEFLLAFFLCSVCCPLFRELFSLDLRNLFLFSTSSVVVTHYTDSSVLTHRCTVWVCCHQHAAEERASTTPFMCYVSSQTWNSVARSQGKVSLL